MGSYSYVRWGDYRLQVYFADDFVERKIGDEVPWKAEFSSPGDYVDGTHEGWIDLHHGQPTEELHRCIVAVKDRRIVEVVRHPESIDTYDSIVARLTRDHAIVPPPRDWWPEIAWEAQQWQRDRYKRPSTGNELADAVNAFTRARMREPGFFAVLFNPRKPRLDLLEFVEQPVLAEFTPQLGWQWGNEMLCDAVEYRAERMLVEAGKWNATPEHPIFVNCTLVEGALRLSINQLCTRAGTLPPLLAQT